MTDLLPLPERDARVRAEFEAWLTDGGKYPKTAERDASGQYRLAMAHGAWAAWRACADRELAYAAAAVAAERERWRKTEGYALVMHPEDALIKHLPEGQVVILQRRLP